MAGLPGKPPPRVDCCKGRRCAPLLQSPARLPTSRAAAEPLPLRLLPRTAQQQSHGLFQALEGALWSPQVTDLGRNSLHPVSALVFSWPAWQPPQGSGDWDATVPGASAALLCDPARRCSSNGNKGAACRAAGWCGTALLTQETVSFFPLQTNKKYIYIYLFFHVELCQNKSVWPQFVDPPPQAEGPGMSPTGRCSAGRLGDRVRLGGRVSPFPEAPRQGDGGAWLGAAARAESQRRGPSPCSETPLPSLGGQKPQGRGPWGLPRTQAFRERETRPCPPAVSSGPWRHCSPVTKPAHLPPPHPRLLSCGTRGRRRACRVLSPGQLL